MEEQATVQDAARRTQEGARRAGERVVERTREGVDEASRMATELAAAGREASEVWADVNQRLIHGLTALTSFAWQENVRVANEVQQAWMDAWHGWQGATWRWQTTWLDGFRDPMRWYHRAIEDGLDATNRTFEMNRRLAEMTGQSFERMQSSAERTSRSLDDTFRSAAGRLQDAYARADRSRAA